MNVVIAGGTGLVGTHLIQKLKKEGHSIFILTRNSTNKKAADHLTYIQWLTKDAKAECQLPSIDVFINLAGETINSRWTTKQKQKILQSRIAATQNCISLMEKLTEKPKVFLNASAIGYYGTSLSTTFTEKDKQPGDNFLARVVNHWEIEALKAEKNLGIRTVLLRFGVVLAKEGGALKKMLLPYQLHVGGQIGSGEQWLSWIHIEDAVNLIYFAIRHEDINGPLNITSPNPMQMKYFGKTLGEVLNKPHWLLVPTFALKLLLGDMSSLILEGQRVMPKKAMEHHFTFAYPNLKAGLESLQL